MFYAGFDDLLAQWQHPIMTAVHSWLVGAALAFVAVGLAMAVWGLTSDEYDMLLPALASMAGSAVVGSVARVVNPFLDTNERFGTWCALAMLVLGLGAAWEYLGGWDFQPFRPLVWVPLAVALGRATMTIPAHVRSGAEQVVVLNQGPDPVKNALVIGAVLLSFPAACVKFVKNLTT